MVKTYFSGSVKCILFLVIVFCTHFANAQTNIPYGTADFNPKPGVSGITYTSSNTAVATIVAGKVHIAGVGTATITGKLGTVTSSQVINVTKAKLVITAISTTGASTYALPQLLLSYTGFVNGDIQAKLSPAAKVTTTATTKSPAGNYPITVSGAGSNNYAITYVNGVLTLGPASFVTSPIPEKTYGNANFYEFGQAVTGVTFTSSNSAVATIVSGQIHIVGAGSATITASNNNSSIPKTLTVKKAPLTIAAAYQYKSQGAANPALYIGYFGFVNGDTTSNLTTKPTAATTATTTSPAGTYPITVSGASSPNYNITYVAGTLNVQAANNTAPNISYKVAASYPEGKAINFSPANTGGTVANTYYATAVTIAGSGSSGNKNGTTPTQSSFASPGAIAFDSEGNYYIADYSNNEIRKITSAGVTSTFAGNGTSGAANGTGTAASFKGPHGLACDAQGNIYVCDRGNNLIRKITPAGVVSTFAGSGNYGSADGQGVAASFSSPTAIAADATGNLYVADGSRKVRKISPTGLVSTLAGSGNNGNADGSGVAASFSELAGIALDLSGDVYVTDYYYGNIRKITPAGKVTTITDNYYLSGYHDGAGKAVFFKGLSGITIDAHGTIYVSEAIENNISRVTLGGLVTYITGAPNPYYQTIDGVPGVATFNSPVALVNDGVSNLYVVDEGDDVVRKLNITGYSINTFHQPLPGGITFSTSGVISGTPSSVFTDTASYRISAFNAYGSSTAMFKFNITNSITSSSNIYTIAGKPNDLVNAGDGGLASAATLQNSYAMTMDKKGNIYIASYTYTIRKIAAKTHIITTIAGTGGYGYAGDNGNAINALFRFSQGTSLAVDSSGNLYVSDIQNNCIRKIDANNIITTVVGGPTLFGHSGDNGPAKSAAINDPSGIAFDSANNLYFIDGGNLVVRKIDSKTQIITTVAGNGKSGYSGDGGAATSAPVDVAERIAIDKNNNLYINEINIGVVRKVDASTHLISTFAGVGEVSVLASASYGRPYTGDGGKAATAIIGGIMGLTFDAAGNLYIVDQNNGVIRKVDATTNIISTYAGIGIGTYGGDGGKATLAGMDGVTDIAFDSSGKMFINDAGNGLIRKIGGTSASDYIVEEPVLNTLSIQPEHTAAEPVVSRALTPNGDGRNDVLTIANIEKYPDNKVMLIGPGGAKVFETTGYDNITKAFNGHSSTNNTLQKPGTYYYIVEYNDKGTVKSTSGYFVLKY